MIIIKIKQMNMDLGEYCGYVYASDPKRHYGECFSKVYIDEEDFEKCKQYGWYITKKGYVYTMIKNRTVFIHRFVLQNEYPNLVVDHHDGEKRNNKKENLRWLTNKENLEKAWGLQKLYETSKPVLMYTKDDIEYKRPLREFVSQNEAEKYLIDQGYGASQGAISNACSGRAKTCCGFRWGYK